MIELLESRLLLASLVNGRPAPDPLDEFISFRLPLATDTTTHYYYDRDATSAARAWNGTTQSYNGHRGTDYSGGPAGKSVYAAADGILAYKEDGWPPGYPDVGGTANGNYVKLVHGNDRNGNPIVTYYLHFLTGTVTTKPIGSFIAAGELIGGVGTTGNSTGLHLHFQPSYDGTAYDPYAAAGEASWWVNQGTGTPATTTPPRKFNVGDFVEVFALSGGTINVRGPNPDSASIGSMPEGSIGQVLSAPALSYTGGDYNNNVYTRYKILFSNGLEGWAAQNWLRPAALQEITVAQGATAIADGQASTISFGSVEKDKPGPTRVFTVTNSGSQMLMLSAPTVPTGFTITEGLATSLAPGASDTFTVRLDSAVVGVKSGQIAIGNNDSDESPFNFPIAGTVSADLTPPTADIVDVTPDPTNGPLGSLSIVFSEPIFNFGINDLAFSRNGGSIFWTAGQTLSTSDNITFTLNGLAAVTAASGTYAISLLVGGVTDGSGNAFISSASETVKVQTSTFRGDATGASADSYYLRRSTDGTMIEVFENQSPGPTPSYTLAWAGLSSLMFDTGGGDNTVTVDYSRGDPIPAGGFSYLAGGGNNTLNLSGAGTFTLSADAASTTPHLTINADGTNLAFASTQHLAALNLTASAAAITGDAKFLITQSLSLAGGATLDLAGNALVVDYAGDSPMGQWTDDHYTGIAGQVGSGAIFSSVADAGAFRNLGAGEASDVLDIDPGQTRLFGSQPVDDTAVLVKYTYIGDANLDGKLNIDDYIIIDSNLPLGTSGYANGDFNFDGKLNIDDYVILDGNLPIQGPPLAWGPEELQVIPFARDFPDLLAAASRHPLNA